MKGLPQVVAFWASLAPQLAARVAEQVDSSAGPDACWPWTGGINEDGYGRFCHEGKSYLAHRAVLALKLDRPLRRTEVTRHKCVGNRRCCNPAHVVSGSIAQNNNDLSLQDRVAHGERGGSAKLTEAQVAEIRQLAPTMAYGRYELLGRRYGVSGKEISNIVRRKKWRRGPQQAAPAPLPAALSNAGGLS
jgi:hypothetical protein